MTPQVEPDHYFSTEYNSKERFVTYWHQIDAILALKPKKILEIGVGSGFVSSYLKKRVDTTTLDIDARLHPNVTGSVLDVPFADESFDVVGCFEVLEHIKYDQFDKALSELLRISSSYVVLTLPDATRAYRLLVQLPKIGVIKKIFSVPKLKKPTHVFDGEHYWEIGKAGFGLKGISGQIRSAGFTIEKTFRVFESPYHRFFLLQKK